MTLQQAAEVFVLPAAFDYGATLLWAISGALLGARYGYDIIGILVLATVSSTGGGLLRDGFFLQDGPPLLVRSPVYLALILLATALVLVLGKRVQRIKGFYALVSLVDAMGLGAYAVVGMNRASVLGLSVLGVALVGMVNAVGGSVLRSIVVAREPHLLRPGRLEAVAALIGCALFILLTHTFQASVKLSAWITIVVVFVVRALAVRYDIKTSALRGFESSA
ncbi:MAG: trimeric intracellular cation channel family protein [Longimicrobiales bacterium]